MDAMQGVNIGGWLVLEQWITPSLFMGTGAQDEYTLCLNYGEQAYGIIQQHRDSFITDQDIAWLVQHGISAIRVPVPHWIFGGFPPFVGGIEHLDWIMSETQKAGIHVLIELHTAPGSQNGNDHSGIKGKIGWHTHELYIHQTLDIIEKLAERYATFTNLLGIGLLNEPSIEIPETVLINYYREAYDHVRRHCNEKVAVVITDRFDPKHWAHIMIEPEYTNVWLDTHLYQAFSNADKKQNIAGVLHKVQNNWKDLLIDIQSTRSVIVGEWSLGLHPNLFRGQSVAQETQALHTFMTTQQEAFSHARAQFFWTYKTESKGGWNYRYITDELLSDDR